MFGSHAAAPPSLAPLFILALLLAGASTTLAADATTDRMIAIYQRLLRVRPNDAESYYKLGDAYIEKGRETGDVTYFELAAPGAAQGARSRPRASAPPIAISRWCSTRCTTSPERRTIPAPRSNSIRATATHTE